MDDLNSNSFYRPVPNDEELNLLDKALLIYEEDPNLAKQLCHKYFSAKFGEEIISKVNDKIPQLRPYIRRGLPKRKQRRRDYVQFQRLYAKNRGSAFQRLYKTTSLSARLTPEHFFQYWQHLFERDAFIDRELPDNNVLPITCDAAKSLIDLVTVEDVAISYPPNKMAAECDGITVKDVRRRIPQRAMAKIFTLWFRICWVP